MSFTINTEINVFFCRAQGHLFATHANSDDTQCPRCALAGAKDARDGAQEYANEVAKERDALKREVSALKGHITKLKKKA